MKKIFLTSLLTIFVFCASNAQEADGKAVNDPVVTNSFWSNWYLQAGLDMTLLNPYGHDFSQVFPKVRLSVLLLPPANGSRLK